MMTDEPEEFAVEPKTLEKHHGEPRSPSSSKRSSMALPSMEQTGDGESHLGASSMSMEDGEDTYPQLLFVILPRRVCFCLPYSIGANLIRVTSFG